MTALDQLIAAEAVVVCIILLFLLLGRWLVEP